MSRLEWPQAISLCLGVIAAVVSLATQVRVIPSWLAVVLVAGVVVIVAILVALAVVPLLARACRRAAARRRRTQAVRQEVLPALAKAQRVLESRLLMGRYIYSWKAITCPRVHQNTVVGPQVPEKCSGMQFVLERWATHHADCVTEAGAHPGSVATVKRALNGLIWIGMTFEDMVKQAGLLGQGVDKQAWEQFRASYHEFISHLEDAAGAAASFVDGIVQHRFDRLPA
jgi:hypothetical protein